MNSTTRDELEAGLRKLSEILTDAGRTLVRLADLVRRDTEESRPAPPADPDPQPAAPKKPKPPPVDWPWEKIVAAALPLLNAAPARLWRPAELSRAIRESGVALATIQGMHFGLVARLEKLDAIEKTESGEIRAKALPAPKPPPPPPRDMDEIDCLAEEIDAGRPYLGDLGKTRRSAQVCAWAGQARALQDRLDHDPFLRARSPALHEVFGRLSTITRDTDCEWVDALSREWTTDWEAYTAYHQAVVAGTYADLAPDKEATLWRSMVRGLFNPRRRPGTYEAHSMILSAVETLSEEDPDVAAAIQRFGRPAALGGSPSSETTRHRRREPAAEEESPSRRIEVPAEVLAFTRGKKALMAGGQGAREEQRLSIEKALELAELEWVTSERNQASQFQRLEERMKPGRYDLVLYLASFSSHKASAFVRAAKASGIPLVYLARGYSVAQVVHGIEEQLVPRRANSPATGAPGS